MQTTKQMRPRKIIIVVLSLLLLFGVFGFSQQISAQWSSISPKESGAKNQVEKKIEQATQPIAFGTTTLEDPNLDQGVAQVDTKGVDGSRTITYEVTYSNGNIIDKKELTNEITTQPINEIIMKGTRQQQPSCPNGTYTNTYGNAVCRPYQSNGSPSGASAQCSDGTYSFSQSRRGTCSGHGGVAVWY